MRKIKILVVFLLVFSLTGCVNGANKVMTPKKQVDFTYWAPIRSDVGNIIEDFGDMTMYKEMEKRTGVKIDFINPSSGEINEKFNLLMAGGKENLPDMIEFYWLNYPGGPDKAIADGVIIDLTELIENHAPNLKKILDSNEGYKKNIATDTGKIFGFPAVNVGDYRTFGGLLIRQDWLDDLGLPVPQTLEQWEETLIAFRDKKGAKSPFTLNSEGFSGGAYHFGNAFETSSTDYVWQGRFVYPPLEDNYRDFIELMHRWYTEGLIDKNFDTNTEEVVDAKMVSGESGVTYGFIGSKMGRYVHAMKDKNPNFKISATPFPVKNIGDRQSFMECQRDVGMGTSIAITGNCKNPEKAVEWIDYLYSDEGAVLKNFGVEGVTYNKVDDRYEYTDEILNNPKGYSIADAMLINFRANIPSPGINQPFDYLDQYYQLWEQKSALEMWSKERENAKAITLPPLMYTKEESEIIDRIKMEMLPYEYDMIKKFIKGEEPMENYDVFRERLIEMGAPEYVNINQNALDRYNRR